MYVVNFSTLQETTVAVPWVEISPASWPLGPLQILAATLPAQQVVDEKFSWACGWKTHVVQRPTGRLREELEHTNASSTARIASSSLGGLKDSRANSAHGSSRGMSPYNVKSSLTPTTVRYVSSTGRLLSWGVIYVCWVPIWCECVGCGD
jgi:hypothetical protein